MLNPFQANELFDVYGALLTPRQQEILQLYYQEDFSYFEISEQLQISRAAVQDSVSRAIKQLQKYESVIGYVSKRQEVLKLCEEKNVDKIKEII